MRPILWVLISGGAVALLIAAIREPAQLHAQPGPHAPIVVELFTSEGCSSCPPADALLIELQKQSQPGAEIIVLSEHVDYWNYIGWNDPYSSRIFSDRQSAYAKSFGTDEVYTPQAVVNGTVGFTGSDADRLSREIAKAATQTVEPLEVKSSVVPGAVIESFATFKAAPQPDAKIFFAVAEDNLESSVKRGENRGRIIRHTGVVRAIAEAKASGTQAGARFDLKPEWKRPDLRVVAFVTAPNGAITAAGSAKLP
jgi:hypothetical protein